MNFNLITTIGCIALVLIWISLEFIWGMLDKRKADKRRKSRIMK